MPAAFAFDVPKGGIDSGNGRHGYRAASPISTAIQELPNVFNLTGIPPNQTWHNMLLQIGNNGKFTSVERRITNPIEALIGFNLEGDEVPTWAGDNNLGVGDFH